MIFCAAPGMTAWMSLFGLSMMSVTWKPLRLSEFKG